PPPPPPSPYRNRVSQHHHPTLIDSQSNTDATTNNALRPCYLAAQGVFSCRISIVSIPCFVSVMLVDDGPGYCRVGGRYYSQPRRRHIHHICPRHAVPKKYERRWPPLLSKQSPIMMWPRLQIFLPRI
ncbi:hypothetical protein ACHAXH_005247, partial [Discostella pseudostelligera]